MYKLVLADADDTLFDFSATEHSAVERTFAGMDAGIPHEELIAEYHRINKILWKEVEVGTMDTKRLRSERFRRLFNELKLPHSPVEYGERYIGYLSEGTTLLEGAEELCRLWSARCPLVIVTNGIADVQRARIERSVIRPYISGIIISEEVGASKPDARMFEAAFACVGHTGKQSAVMIGDSLTSDIQGGMNFGIDTCWYNPKGLPNTLEKEPTYQVQSLSELKSII
ncbi:MAG: YjjG family noncanonical pyrimidine nucleotidase [Bacteroidota bacterium]